MGAGVGHARISARTTNAHSAMMVAEKLIGAVEIFMAASKQLARRQQLRHHRDAQQWSFQAWNVAAASLITAAHLGAATPTAIVALDAGLFRLRCDRLIPKEQQYLCAMAKAGEVSQRSADVATRFGRSTDACDPIRDNLIRKGMIYSSEHGQGAFTVPLFGGFVRRAMPAGINPTDGLALGI